jgi:large subunit ribosomal protein L24e
MPKCTFCGDDIQKGTGTMFVKKDGKILWFCSGKCEKALLELKRKPISTKWSKFYMKGGKVKEI